MEERKGRYRIDIYDTEIGTLIEGCNATSLYLTVQIGTDVVKKISLGERAASFSQKGGAK